MLYLAEGRETGVVKASLVVPRDTVFMSLFYSVIAFILHW
jgi:hypothetical protein